MEEVDIGSADQSPPEHPLFHDAPHENIQVLPYIYIFHIHNINI